MYTVYIIQSQTNGKYYVGYTENLEDRLRHHNAGANRSTRPGRPWKVVYRELYTEKRLAWSRERQIKSYKGGSAFKKLIHGGVA